jgi:uncharacterized coiled-coil DUF342 family protein
LFLEHSPFLQDEDEVRTVREQLGDITSERDRLLEEVAALREKLSEVENERKTLLQLNLDWQRKELERKSSASKRSSSGHKVCKINKNINKILFDTFLVVFKKCISSARFC